jgi:hypothetical protein
LDVTPYNYPSNDTCVGSFVPQSVSIGVGQLCVLSLMSNLAASLTGGHLSDWLIGVNVLRSVYSVYDFGDFDSSGTPGNPYVQLLSIIDPNQASADFASVRGTKANTNITYNVSPNVGSGSTVATSQSLSSTLDKLNTYIPAMLAIMALNALVIVLLIVFGIVYLCRGRRRGSDRKNRGRASPIPLNPVSPDFRLSEQSNMAKPHTYEPVSMAISEDTFVPPSPAFRKGSTSGTRPYSYQPASPTTNDDPFTPPSPPFRKSVKFSSGAGLRVGSSSSDERPKSVA